MIFTKIDKHVHTQGDNLLKTTCLTKLQKVLSNCLDLKILTSILSFFSNSLEIKSIKICSMNFRNEGYGIL